jgi:SAM-dependent methyltransferase
MRPKPDWDDEHRRQFLVTLKRFTNLDLMDAVRGLVAQDIRPRLENQLGRSLENNRDDRARVADALLKEPLYQGWEAMTYISQGMMWSLIADVLEYDLPRLQQVAATQKAKPNTRGSLTLDPDLEVPRYIANHEIHRQPGGFALDQGPNDITAGAIYAGGGLIYGPGKHPSNQVGYGAAGFLIHQIEERFPDLKPQRILDVGCATGANTVAYAQHYPDAEVHGIDCAPGFLRFAHALAESQDTAVHYGQMNAEKLSFADESFDLVVSHIVGHETSLKALPRVIAECYRVVKPGGVVLHMDVSTQVSFLGLADQVMNDWQVRHNGEHFWTGWAEADVRALMLDAGYPESGIIAEHAQRNETGPAWFVHGARKPA